MILAFISGAAFGTLAVIVFAIVVVGERNDNGE